jgi:glucose 1-dehydrogenase
MICGGFMKLPNKVVFITDADSRSGKAFIKRLADEGAHFILNSVSNGKDLTPSLKVCQVKGSKALIVNIDLCKGAEINAMLENAAQRLGTVDVLLHNNNVIKPASVENCEEDRFLEILNANAKSAFLCAQAVGKQMAAKQSGSIIFVSSIHAEKPTGSSFAYSASKGAVKMLTLEASLILGRHDINVNVIEMGPVEGDDAVFKSDISSLYDHYRYKIPNAVPGTYGDLAELALFLCTDEARYVNGADIRLDGGFLMHYMDFKMKKPADKEV